MLTRAKSEAADLVASAESRESQARADADRGSAEQAAALQRERELAHRQAEQEASGRIEAARHEAEELLERARVECRSMVQQAQDLRTKVLTDLTNRRRVLHLQIEQLRAGRERLSETIQGARQSVDDNADELMHAEDEARLAAEAAGRTAAGLPDNEAGETLGGLSPGAEGTFTDLGATEPTEAVPSSGSSQGSGDTTGDAARDTTGDTAESPTAPQVGGSTAETVHAQIDASFGAGNEEGRDQQVEDLFARLRASSIGDGASVKASEESLPESSRSSGPDPEPEHVAGEDSSDETTGATGTNKVEPVAAASTGSLDEPTLVLDRPLQLIRRDELLGPVIAGLARRVKRALQDDQNDILDRLRSQGGWKEGVLPEVADHRARYIEASKEMLAEAARAGSTFAGVSIERAKDVAAESAELASALVVPLRRRLEEDCPTVDPTDDAALVEHVGAAFREWRGDRTERLAGDRATAAFAASAVAGMSGDLTIRWLVDDEGAPCADCEDNALAEDVSPGDPFPTGHPHPPAHSGCRCLLVVRAT
jgi:hypothetical protein